MQPGWCQPIRQEFMENECEALAGVAYPGVWDNCSTLNTKTGYDDVLGIARVVPDKEQLSLLCRLWRALNSLYCGCLCVFQ